jgi:hypothetical protein
MIYRYQSIIDSDCDVVICPTRADEEILEGSLHEKLVCLLESGYTRRHFEMIQNHVLVVGQPFVYYCQEDDWAGRWVINFPVAATMTFGEFMSGVEKCLQIAKNTGKIDSIGVVIPIDDIPWSEDMQEWAWLFHEGRVLADMGIQVEVYTAGDSDETTPEVVVDVETEEVLQEIASVCRS